MIYTTPSAYRHAFSPRTTGEYAISLVESGWDPPRAVRQAAVEHGFEQAEEFAAACCAHLPGGRHVRTPRAWLRVARRALKTLGEENDES